MTGATAAGDTFVNDGNTIYKIANGGGGATVVTFDDTESVSPPGATAFDADVAVSVPAGEDAYVGPFTLGRFTASMSVTMTVDTSVTVAALRIP